MNIVSKKWVAIILIAAPLWGYAQKVVEPVGQSFSERNDRQ